MFKFSDNSYIDGQLDLCQTLNNKYASMNDCFFEPQGYDLERYEENSALGIKRIVFEAGKNYDYHSSRDEVLAYWRARSCPKGNNAILHKFEYTNNTDQTAQVFVTYYDHFQNNKLSYYDWYGNYCPYYYSSSSSNSDSSSSGHYEYDFGSDGDIDARIHCKRNYRLTDVRYSWTTGWWFWQETHWGTRKEMAWEDDYTTDCSDNNRITFKYCDLPPGQNIEIYLSGEDGNSIPDPECYLKVEVIFDGNIPEASEKPDNKPAADPFTKESLNGFVNNLNLKWVEDKTSNSSINTMNFGWVDDKVDNEATIMNMHWRI
jgi:hypothetical protein